MSTHPRTTEYGNPAGASPVMLEADPLPLAPYSFCTTSDPTCPCRSDPDLLTRVQANVRAGLLTDEEASRMVHAGQLPMMRPSTSNLFAETKKPLAVSPVEWLPLDGLIQTWAGFAHATVSDPGLEAASAAFAALALETRARQSSAAAVRERASISWSPRWQMLVLPARSGARQPNCSAACKPSRMRMLY